MAGPAPRGPLSASSRTADTSQHCLPPPCLTLRHSFFSPRSQSVMAAAVKAKTTNSIGLKGSAQIVAEFFGTSSFASLSPHLSRCGLRSVRMSYCLTSPSLLHTHTCPSPPRPRPAHPRAGYSINSILYQRGIYDPDTFTTVKKYGLKMQVTTDDGLSTYLRNVLKQLAGPSVTSSPSPRAIAPWAVTGCHRLSSPGTSVTPRTIPHTLTPSAWSPSLLLSCRPLPSPLSPCAVRPRTPSCSLAPSPAPAVGRVVDGGPREAPRACHR